MTLSENLVSIFLKVDPRSYFCTRKLNFEKKKTFLPNKGILPAKKIVSFLCHYYPQNFNANL